MRMIATVIASILLLASGHALASQVTGVALEYKDGSAVAHIEVEGQVHFTHQTEEARDGRPFRVIVDVLSATHQLPARNFTSLPACPVQQIRTSQFAVRPEKVVRLVFDMEEPTFYRVESSDHAVSVFFPDQQQRRFAAWSSESYSAADQRVSKPSAEKPVTEKEVASKTPPIEKSAVEVQQDINEDRLLSLTAEAPQTSASASKQQQPPSETAETQKPSAPSPRSRVEVAETSSEKTDVKADQPSKQASPQAPPVSPPQVEKPKAEAPARKSTTEPETRSVVPQPAKPAANEQVTSSEKPSSPKKGKAKGDSTETVKDGKGTEKKSSTSRFRRSPTSPTKIKGTLVAEFPKRLVIKYKTRGTRDPFETLINQTKTYNSPIERQIPSVEVLRLVGVIESDSGPNSALLEDKHNFGYILTEGDKVRNGYVLRVESDRVYFQLFEYGWSRTVALSIDEY